MGVSSARACLPGSHYVDLANDIAAVSGLLGLHDEAVAAGRTPVTGAGFSVLATEAVVTKLCQGRPAPSAVRVDAVASVDSGAGVAGDNTMAVTAELALMAAALSSGDPGLALITTDKLGRQRPEVPESLVRAAILPDQWPSRLT